MLSIGSVNVVGAAVPTVLARVRRRRQAAVPTGVLLAGDSEAA
ncbi:MAG TPA: hypothetical protein VF312_09310 [Propionibacteriaceae bacterium]